MPFYFNKLLSLKNSQLLEHFAIYVQGLHQDILPLLQLKSKDLGTNKNI